MQLYIRRFQLSLKTGEKSGVWKNGLKVFLLGENLTTSIYCLGEIALRDFWAIP
jgi:hypothetical protein